MPAPIVVTSENHIAILKLNRPDTRNAISEMDMIDAFEKAIDDINANQDIRVVILTGEGSAFSSGGNIKHMLNKEGMFAGSKEDIKQGYKTGIQRIPLAMYRLAVPAIAAVNGPAVGAGCDLTCMCDVRIASDKARFAESFIKVGLIPGDGGAWFLPRTVGMSQAAEMAFTGDAIDAQKALSIGLVSQVVEHKSLMAEANKLAQRMACNPPQVLRQTKRLLRAGQQMNLPELLELSAEIQSDMHLTNDHIEAVSAMLEKRSANFTGR